MRIAGYLTALHKQPVCEGRVMVTASGMAALPIGLSAILRAGDRVVLHEPAWPNAGNAARLRGAKVGADRARRQRQDGAPLVSTSRQLDRGARRRPPVHPQFAQ